MESHAKSEETQEVCADVHSRFPIITSTHESLVGSSTGWIAMTASTHCFVGLDESDPPGSLVMLRIRVGWTLPQDTTMDGNTEEVA